MQKYFKFTIFFTCSTLHLTDGDLLHNMWHTSHETQNLRVFTPSSHSSTKVRECLFHDYPTGKVGRDGGTVWKWNVKGV